MSAEETFMIWFIVAHVYGVIWGFATKAVIRNKGYRENWFWWGFLGGWIVFVVALTRPVKVERPEPESTLSRAAKEVDQEKILRDGGWKCHCCGAINAKLSSTCKCGATKIISSDVQTSDVMWKCNGCGKENEKYIFVCSCGVKKSENDTIEPRYEVDSDTIEFDRSDNIEAIKKYKELLDIGAITQEEFDIKKKELL